MRFASERLRITPSQIDLAQVDAPVVLGVLTDIRKRRGNTARTCNASRLAAIKSFFRYLEYREPLHTSRAGNHGIPLKKRMRARRLSDCPEIQALLDAPDASTAFGLQRDRAMLHVAYACGLRVC